MKRLISVFVAVIMVIIMCFTLTGCGPKEPAVQLSELEKTLLAASKMTNEELYEKAKEEKGTMEVYSTTSLCGTAVKNFLEKYSGLSAEYSSVGEADMFTKLTAEIGSAAKGADMALLQNAYRMQNELISEGLLVNYFPSMYSEVVPDEYKDPCVLLLVHKPFFFNNTAGNINLENVWQLTNTEYKGRIFFKDPSNEPVGMNFLVMLTSPEWNSKLEVAYKNYYGKDWSASTGFASAAYQWIDGFLANCNYTYAADGGIAEGVSTGAAGNIGLFVFSKLRSGSVTRDNLTIAATATKSGTGLDCFSGFMYPTYAQICKDTDMPYTCALFINYILSQEGFTPWNNENVMGTYSSNTSIPLVMDSTGLDKEMTYWKNCMVVEDGAYIASAYADVYEFISTRLK